VTDNTAAFGRIGGRFPGAQTIQDHVNIPAGGSIMAGNKSLEELKLQLNGWKAKIDDLSQQAAGVKPEMQAKYLDIIDGLKQKIQTLHLFVKDLEKEKGAGLEKVMNDVEKMMTDLDEGYRNALVYFP
jgi:uncharacterized coiled-coil DUF342 family protein